MATHQLGPESPRPFSVISEDNAIKNLYLPYIPEHELYSFGPAYERRMCELIHQYLELGTDDKLCYVGQPKGSLAPLLQEAFCILQPVTSVVPGHIHFQETNDGEHVVPIRISHVGAEEFFKMQAIENPEQFDKVLLHDSLQYLANPIETYINIMKTLKPSGRLLIIHRPAPLTTLPLFGDAKKRMAHLDEHYMAVIKQLQELHLDVQWEIQSLPIIMTRLKWFSMLQNKYPNQLGVISDTEIRTGIRELSEGVLKYASDTVEFGDRLLFISASHNAFTTYPSVQRFGADAAQPYPGLNGIRYVTEVTSDLSSLLNARQKESLGKRK